MFFKGGFSLGSPRSDKKDGTAPRFKEISYPADAVGHGSGYKYLSRSTAYPRISRFARELYSGRACGVSSRLAAVYSRQHKADAKIGPCRAAYRRMRYALQQALYDRKGQKVSFLVAGAVPLRRRKAFFGLFRRRDGASFFFLNETYRQSFKRRFDRRRHLFS